MKKKSRLPLIFLICVVALMYLPIAQAVVTSFNESKLASVWGGFSLKWYKALFTDRYIGKALVNSLVLAFSACLISAVIATAAALAFRRSVPLKKAVKALTMVPIMIPDIILGMVFLAYFRLLHLPFGMLTLIIAHVSFCTPHIFLQVSARAAMMDDSPAEAAKLLGAGPVRTFFDITLPYLMPAELSGMLIAFAMSFDDVIISMFVTGVSVNTLPIQVYSQVKTGLTPETNALCTVMLLVAGLCTFGARKLKKKDKLRNS